MSLKCNGQKRAFIVTDNFYMKITTQNQLQINSMKWEFNTLHSSMLSLTQHLLVQRGRSSNESFKPDCIIALGGSAMDAAKIMWVMYEHPEADFMDMAMRFIDIRKRVYTFPKWAKKRISLLFQHQQVLALK